MPPRALHLDQARRNVETIEHLLTKDAAGPRQWAVVASFYCALHCVEAHFATHNRHYFNHGDRRHAMANDPDAPPVGVYTAYGILENQAYLARYEMLQLSRADVDQLLRSYLRPIRQFVGLARAPVQQARGWGAPSGGEVREGVEGALVDTYLPYATVIRVVLDNSNIHALASPYEAFTVAPVRGPHGTVLGAAVVARPIDGRWAHGRSPPG